MKNLNLKFFIYLVSNRRNFIPILSIYFLSLPNTLANQIGLYNGIGFIASFLLEIPSSYFADTFGHKKTLILSKIFQILSISFYILGSFVSFKYIFFLFSLGALCQSIGFSLFSGTATAFFHEILEDQGKEKLFSKFIGKLRGNASLVSIPIIILLPLLTTINIILPFIVALIIDIIGFIALYLIPKSKNNIKRKEKKNIIKIFKNIKNTKILGLSISIGMIIGFLIGSGSFRGVYLESLGYPIAFIGLIMGGSRLIRFITGHYAHLIEKYFTIKQYFLIEVFLYPIAFFSFAYFSNPYIVGLLFSLVVGFQWGRKGVIQSFIINDIKDKNYKATILSIEAQINAIAGIIVSFGISFIMGYSYKEGYSILGIILFFILLINYFYTFTKKN